jgi:hypothetical protein
MISDTRSPAGNSPPAKPAGSAMVHLRAAFDECGAPRFLLHLFDRPDGTYMVEIDDGAIPAPAIFEPYRNPRFAQLQVESTAEGRWAQLTYNVQMTEDADPVYFVAVLTEQGLAAAWKADESGPHGDEDVFSTIDLIGITTTDVVADFLECLNFPSIAEPGRAATPFREEE